MTSASPVARYSLESTQYFFLYSPRPAHHFRSYYLIKDIRQVFVETLLHANGQFALFLGLCSVLTQNIANKDLAFAKGLTMSWTVFPSDVSDTVFVPEWAMVSAPVLD